MRQFENQVQLIKYEILKKVSKFAFEETLSRNAAKIPSLVDQGPEPRFRCCVYHERAVSQERVMMALGGNKDNPNLVEVLDSACDQCPTDRFVVTEACRGCLSHRCESVCPVDAITIDHQRAKIDYNKCIECGKCKDACPYNSIIDIMRPCQRACPVSAIEINPQKKAVIKNDLCIQCGACVYQCPFGAMQDKSEVVDVINCLNEAQVNDQLNVYAVIAPAFSTQFNFANLGQVVKGIKMLGFKDAIEVSLGADMVTRHETEEFLHSEQYMTTSCCPAFVDFIKIKHPHAMEHVSTTVSPMIAVSQLVKQIDPQSKVVFIGPCIAKKGEKNHPDIKGITDFVLTFEELAAMLDAKEINLSEIEEAPLNNASFSGRNYAASGGVTNAIKSYIDNEQINSSFSPVVCDGIDECDKALKMAKVNRLPGNFIEGMACKGGCIKGPVTMHHGNKDKKALLEYAKQAKETNPNDSLRIFNTEKIQMERNFNL